MRNFATDQRTRNEVGVEDGGAVVGIALAEKETGWRHDSCTFNVLFSLLTYE